MAGDISLSEVLDRCARSGVAISADQLERWRGRGLLPPAVQTHITGRRGSQALYPEITVPQALTIARLLAERHKLDRVGWRLWWEGYEVSNEHWRPELDRVAKWIGPTFQRYSRMLDIGGRRTLMERSGRRLTKGLPIAASTRRMTDDAIYNGLTTLARSAFGQFRSFGKNGEDDDDDQRYEATRNLLGFKRGEHHEIFGHRIKYRAGMEVGLSAIADSDLLNASFQNADLERILLARDQVRDAFRTGNLLNGLFYDRWGNGAWGLSLAKWFDEKAPSRVQAAILLLWMNVDRRQENFLSNEEIAASLQALEKLH